MIRQLQIAVFLAVSIALGPSAQGQSDSFPSRPAKIIVPFPPGSTVDILGRVVGQGLTESLKQNFLVENRPGASGNIGIGAAAKSAPDGYTLLLAPVALVVNPLLFPNVPFDSSRDFSPIAPLATTANLVVVGPASTLDSVRAVVAAAKAAPGKLNYGSSGIGTTLHLSGELFNRMAGVSIVHVPYKGPVEMLNDLMSGRLDLAFPNVSSALPLVRAGKLKALAVTTLQRHPSIPDVPTVAESGLDGYEAIAWFGLVAPAGTPNPIIDKLNAEVVATLNGEEARKRLSNIGIDLATGTPEQFAVQLEAEKRKWADVIRASGAKGN